MDMIDLMAYIMGIMFLVCGFFIAIAGAIQGLFLTVVIGISTSLVGLIGVLHLKNMDDATTITNVDIKSIVQSLKEQQFKNSFPNETEYRWILEGRRKRGITRRW